jgi:SseB protein N-terminal domain
MSEVSAIEAAISILCDSPTQDNRAALYRTLLGAGELYLVVSAPPGSQLAPEVKLPKDAVIPLLTTTSPEGKPAVLAFTSLNHLQRRSPAAAGFTKLPTARVLDLVMNGTYEALVLNAAGPWASIPRADVEVIRRTLVPVVPPVDLSVPVTNPCLVAAIEKHQKAQSKQTAEELFGELKDAVFLVAIILDNPPVKVSEGQSLFNRGDKIAVVEVRDNKDSRLLALFTDHTELQRFANRANSTLVMRTKDAMSFVLDKDYSGLVVNPAGEATFRVDSAFIPRAISGM